MNANRVILLVAGVLVVVCICLFADLSLGVLIFWPLRPSAVSPAPTLVEQPGPQPRLSPVPSVPRSSTTPVPATRPAGPTPVASAPAALPADHSATLRAVNQANVPDRDLYALARAVKKVRGPIPVTVTAPPHQYKVGDRETFWVGNQTKKEYFQVTATLRHITPHVYMWVGDGISVADADVKQAADQFENPIYPTDRRYFGSEWTPGVDDDPHLVILNALGMDEGVAGYYSSADEYPREVDAHSNQHEMFYVNANARLPGTRGYGGLLAHEFQHMIHWNEDKGEEGWVNEGASSLAEALNGYDTSHLVAGAAASPGVQLTTWAEDMAERGDHYATSFMFAKYFAQRFGPEAMRDVVAEPADGVEGYSQVLARHSPGLTFDDFFADWVVANYLDDPKLGDGRYGYSDLDIKAAPVTQVKRVPGDWRHDVHPYAADYVELQPPGTQPLTVSFEGSLTIPLVAGLAHSGRYAWWSNREDSGDMTLTREVDLSGAKTATLKFATWYDLEGDWDYAYVEASQDGGQTWDMLSGLHSTTSDPNGNNLGTGWTGQSGATQPGEPPKWVEEQVDLTPYAGGRILLRFECVTDDAVNNPGWLVDDITIPEIQYRDDVEAGDSGWQARGFVRSDDVLPLSWLVQLIQVGRQTRVQRVPVGADGRAQVTIAGLGSDVERAVLVVSGVAPRTTESAAYRLRVETGQP